MSDEQALAQLDTEIATVRRDQPSGTEVTADSLKLRNEHLPTFTPVRCSKSNQPFSLGQLTNRRYDIALKGQIA